MLVDDNERFILELSLKLGIPAFELEEWPSSEINRYKALNVISPFTDKAQAVRDGLLMSLIRNQNVTKKSQAVTPSQLLPYLEEFPSYLEHKDVTKAQSLLKNATQDWQVADIKKHIQEAIEAEQAKADPDTYLISRFKEMVK
ncbi:hypothetical protein RA178_06300 [Shewanella oncorhynchi]|uniref:Uncharacterized protein n=1 Tax=Shewanella oncorhynchi TaxID=2726434 RepID=A0AA50KG33_9GAMM|nr:hypothetical protein [Shewanella oncorhynchi]WMB74223.1 hypothetical protein RA178_06300 [Shewanella oncorhynchi]